MPKILKTVLLATDGVCDVRVDMLARSLNQVCRYIRFDSHPEPIRPLSPFISNPSTYQGLGKITAPLIARHSSIIIATSLPYDNNFFFESYGLVTFISFSGWKFLTRLPKSNGMAGFIASILAHELNDGTHHDSNTGCVFDFMWDKSGIDGKLRGGTMCGDCLVRIRRIAKQTPKKRLRQFNCTLAEGLEDFQALLDEISLASKRDIDVLNRWKTKAGVSEDFDVFLCHNSADKPHVRKLYGGLTRRGLRPWLDEKHLRPGFPWQDQLQTVIPKIRAAVVTVGRNGKGPWQQMELREFLVEFTRRACPVIPVILRDARKVPELPVFLRSFQWVDFRKANPDPWKNLIWGITGRAP